MNLRDGSLQTAEGQPGVDTARRRASQVGAWAVYVAIALSGLSALGAEVVWTRLLSLMLGGTVYTFSIILAVFLAGLGIGSSVGSYLSRSTVRPGLRWAAASSAGRSRGLDGLHDRPVTALLADQSRAFPEPMVQLPTGPGALSVGSSAGGNTVGGELPVGPGARSCRPERIRDDWSAGCTPPTPLGAIVGALAFSLLVIPWVGTQWAQRLLLGISAAAGLLMLAPLSIAGVRLRRGFPVWLRVRSWLAARWPRGFAGLGHRPGPLGIDRLWPLHGDLCRPVGARDQAGERRPHDRRQAGHLLHLFGRGPERLGRRDPEEIGRAQLPFRRARCRPPTTPRTCGCSGCWGTWPRWPTREPESVLVVACGAGVTAGSFVVHPDIKRIVICDIEPLVPRFVAPMFAKENYGVVQDPRTEIVLDDGRHFVRTTKEKFDIITSDPIDPWVKGCAALNTVEYYQMCKAHLKPGGVMALWMPLYESNIDSTKSLIATFFKVFPNGILWSNDADGEGYDAVLFGQARADAV